MVKYHCPKCESEQTVAIRYSGTWHGWLHSLTDCVDIGYPEEWSHGRFEGDSVQVVCDDCGHIYFVGESDDDVLRWAESVGLVTKEVN